MAKKKSTPKKAAKKTSKKAAKKAPKKPSKKKAPKKTSKKSSKKKTTKPPKKAPKATNTPPSDADIAARAYYVYLDRVQWNKPGDPYGDWIEAIRQLSSE
ncbi:MAG: hypothetical protein AAGC74_00900 [Verrucomicrobiota bacterium]